MIPDDPTEIDQLAGEYVLGVLEADDAAEVAAALGYNTELRQAVAYWEGRLAPLVDQPVAEPPPAGLWVAVAARLDADEANARFESWRRIAFAAGGLAAMLLLIVVAALRSPPGLPDLIAVLQPTETSAPGWLASERDGQLVVRALDLTTAPAGHSFELWAIEGSAAPASLGVVESIRRVPLPEALKPGTVLAVTLEPEGGSPTGKATGPILGKGALLPTL